MTSTVAGWSGTSTALGAPSRVVDSSQPSIPLNFPRFMVLCALHGLFSAYLPTGSVFATLYVVGVTGLALATTAKNPSNGIYWVAYLLGAELVWRIAQAGVFWEWGKYSAAALLLVSWRHRAIKSPVQLVGLAYFLLLLPACAATLSHFDLHTARTRIAFNLSGPFLIAVSMLVVSATPLLTIRPRRLLAALALPIVGLSARVLQGIISTEDIYFEAEASYATSAGYGPNQVATILGLGSLVFVMLGLYTKNRLQQLVLYAMAAGLLAQTMLTFSRGGVVAAVVGIGAVLIHYLVSPRNVVRYLLGFLVAVILLTSVVLPRLDAWTGGKLGERFSSLETTGRVELFKAELDLFRRYPVLGVGTGLAQFFRGDAQRKAAHTEFSRMLAEHGSLGALSILLILAISVYAYIRAPTMFAKAWVAALLGWSFTNMSTAALRLGAAAGIIGLAFIDFGSARRNSDEGSNEPQGQLDRSG